MYPSIYMGPPDRVMRVHSEAAGCVMSFVLCCAHLSVRAPPRVGWHVDAGSGEFNLWMGATSGSTFNFLHVAKNKMYCM